MLARRRRELIAAHVQRHGSARVSDLTTVLGVSDMTIRRDLEVLDPGRRARQGARRGDAPRRWRRPPSSRGSSPSRPTQIDEKRAIAGAAARCPPGHGDRAHRRHDDVAPRRSASTGSTT